MRLALYQPDIPQNAGALIRLGACLGRRRRHHRALRLSVQRHASFRRAGMDYLDAADIVRHASWATFLRHASGRALCFSRTKARANPIWISPFAPDDVLCWGGRARACPPLCMRGRRALAYSDEDRHALAQCGAGGRHGPGRGAAADEGISGMTDSDLDAHKQRARAWFEDLRDRHLRRVRSHRARMRAASFGPCAGELGPVHRQSGWTRTARKPAAA